MDTTRLLDELVLHTAAFADAVRVGDRSATVPTCPEWTVADLAQHLGAAHRFACAIVTDPDRQRPPMPAAAVPDSDDETSTWLLEGAAALAEAVRVVGPETRVAGVVPGDESGIPARFWARRMAAETLVHRFDAELAAGVDPWRDVAVDAVADAIDENLWMLTTYGPMFRPALAGRGETLHVHLTDAGGEWVITRQPAGPRVEHAHRKADVAVRGPAAAVLAVLTNRRDPIDAGIEVLGDAGLFEDWRKAAAI